MSLKTFMDGYIKAALWSSTDDHDKSLDKSYGPSDIAPETLERMKADCSAFYLDNGGTIAKLHEDHFDDKEIGHDFWLTRNGHGAGFWDGDYPKPQADKLTAAAKRFGMADLYVGDDEQLYLGGGAGLGSLLSGNSIKLIGALAVGFILGRKFY